VPDRSDVYVGLLAYEFLFGHLVLLSLSRGGSRLDSGGLVDRIFWSLQPELNR
jgi:hypothetical protein